MFSWNGEEMIPDERWIGLKENLRKNRARDAIEGS